MYIALDTILSCHVMITFADSCSPMKAQKYMTAGGLSYIVAFLLPPMEGMMPWIWLTSSQALPCMTTRFAFSILFSSSMFIEHFTVSLVFI